VAAIGFSKPDAGAKAFNNTAAPKSARPQNDPEHLFPVYIVGMPSPTEKDCLPQQTCSHIHS
jgi:hypothetical protein